MATPVPTAPETKFVVKLPPHRRIVVLIIGLQAGLLWRQSREEGRTARAGPYRQRNRDQIGPNPPPPPRPPTLRRLPRRPSGPGIDHGIAAYSAGYSEALTKGVIMSPTGQRARPFVVRPQAKFTSAKISTALSAPGAYVNRPAKSPQSKATCAARPPTRTKWWNPDSPFDKLRAPSEVEGRTGFPEGRQKTRPACPS